MLLKAIPTYDYKYFHGQTERKENSLKEQNKKYILKNQKRKKVELFLDS